MGIGYDIEKLLGNSYVFNTVPDPHKLLGKRCGIEKSSGNVAILKSYREDMVILKSYREIGPPVRY